MIEVQDLDRLKQATRQMWSLGDYTAVALLLEPYARQLADACRIERGAKLLDVAAGNGNFAVAASERGADVTACDTAPRMLELGRARTSGLPIDWREGDAEELPFPDESFDVVGSVFGAMFAPRPQRVAEELFRVCRQGGLVAMANYGPDGFLAATSSLFSRYSTPLPFDLPSPFEWGDPAVIRDLFSGLASTIEVRSMVLTMTFDSVESGVDFWERTNPPMIALRMRIAPETYAECRRELGGLMSSLNRSSSGHLELKNAYLEVLARK